MPAKAVSRFACHLGPKCVRNSFSPGLTILTIHENIVFLRKLISSGALWCSADLQSAVSPNCIRQVIRSTAGIRVGNGQWITNPRYGRMQFCATPAAAVPRCDGRRCRAAASLSSDGSTRLVCRLWTAPAERSGDGAFGRRQAFRGARASGVWFSASRRKPRPATFPPWKIHLRDWAGSSGVAPELTRGTRVLLISNSKFGFHPRPSVV